MAIYSEMKKAKLSRTLQKNLEKGYAVDTSVIMYGLNEPRIILWNISRNKIVKWLKSNVMKTIYSENLQELILLNRRGNIKKMENLLDNPSVRFVSCEQNHDNDYHFGVRDLRRELEKYPISRIDRILILHAKYEKLPIVSFDKALLETAEKCEVRTHFIGGGLPYDPADRGEWPRKIYVAAK